MQQLPHQLTGTLAEVGAAALINDALQGVPLTGAARLTARKAIDVSGMETAAAAAHGRAVAFNAGLLRFQPWRIAKVVYGTSQWPVAVSRGSVDVTLDLTEILAEAHRLFEASMAQLRSGWWAYSRPTIHVAREAAVAALVTMIAEEK